MKKSFASDNAAPIHPDVLEAIIAANQGHFLAYGADPYTERAIQRFKQIFGEETEVFFVYNGTGANVTGLTAITQSFHTILCAETGHLHVDECGAPEKHTGCKVLAIPTENGKLSPEQIKPYLLGFGDEHRSQPKVISITQSTEYGTVYSLAEIKAITALAEEYDLLVHMDGARIANAAVSLGTGLKQMTRDLGIDLLSFGGTKNGLMIGEAVLFFKPELAKDFPYIRKQGMQLHSKMRYISAQFEALLNDDLWRKNAEQANRMASLLAEQLRDIPQIRLTQEVEANVVFASLPMDVIKRLQEDYYFYIWNEAKSEVRWMTSFDTTEEDIAEFVQKIRSYI